ncbi:MAG: hypothetical protein ACXVRP_14795 [Solirubrobacteraceae bacterium]
MLIPVELLEDLAPGGAPAVHQRVHGRGVGLEVEPALARRHADLADAVAEAGQLGLQLVAPVARGVLYLAQEGTERLGVGPVRGSHGVRAGGHPHRRRILTAPPVREWDQVQTEGRMAGQPVVEEVDRKLLVIPPSDMKHSTGPGRSARAE